MIEKPVKICSQPGWFHYHGRIVTVDDPYVNMYADTYVLSSISRGERGVKSFAWNWIARGHNRCHFKLIREWPRIVATIVVVGFRIVRVDFQGLLIVGHSVVELSL
jgi:hypothetical protein